MSMQMPFYLFFQGVVHLPYSFFSTWQILEENMIRLMFVSLPGQTHYLIAFLIWAWCK